MNLLCCCPIMAPSTRITRKWEIFAGRNRFYCDGLLMSAPHTGVFYLTCFLITGTSVLFFAFDCPYLATRITPFIPIIGAILYFFTMSSLLRTTFTDPGVIPRASHDEAAYIEKQIEVPNSLNSPTYRPPPRTKEVLVKGQVVKLKYCFTCKIFRPPRASHCSLCDNCVDRFDHHCPWVGNCVGKRNYRFFYMFLVSLAFLAVFIFSCSITHLVLLMKVEKEIWEVIKTAPVSVIVTIICFFSIWSVIGLAGFHTYLTTSDQTTNEDLKGSFSSKSGQRAINPYSRGNICLNCIHILCGPMTPSLIDRRGIVTDDYMLQMQHYSPSQLHEVTTIQQSAMIAHQPILGGNDVLKPLPRMFDETNPASGIYRHRSYDNLQNGNSNSLAHLVDNEIPLSTLDGIQQQQDNQNLKLNQNNLQNPSINSAATSNYGGSSGIQPPLSPIISPMSNLGTILIDDDNMDASGTILSNQNRNLSGSYNNLFRDGLDNSFNENLNDRNESTTIQAPSKLQQSSTMHDIMQTNSAIKNLPTQSKTLHDINLATLPQSASTLDEFQQNDNDHNNITSASTRRLLQLQNLTNESENVYSNISPINTTINDSVLTTPSGSFQTTNLITLSNPDNDLNKSDPSLHVYSNLIEEKRLHDNNESKPQIQPVIIAQQNLQPKSQLPQLSSTTTTHLSSSNESNNIPTVISQAKIELISPLINKPLDVNNIPTVIKTSKRNSKDEESLISSISPSSTNSIDPSNIMSSTLLSDDLDLDDPFSAFVANTRNRKLQQSRKKDKKNSESDKINNSNNISGNSGNIHSNIGSSSGGGGGKESSRLKHLHDTTMIDTALDLDSLDGTSIGLVKSSAIM